jgi:hypothetical protein
MTAQPAPTPHTTADAVAEALPRAWQRLLALSGVVFAALFVVGWFTTGGVTPHYPAPVKDPGFLGGSDARLCPGGRRCCSYGSLEEVLR